MNKKIEDYGEKIGGAKKDLWKQRGLMISDFEKMNDRESEKYVTKDNVWIKPDYMQLVENGLDIKIAYFRKVVRDALPRKPEFSYSDVTEEDRKERVRNYIRFVRDLKESVEKCKTKNDLMLFFEDFFVRNAYISMGRGRFCTLNKDFQGIISNKLLKAVQVNEYTYKNYDREIKKKRFCYSETDKIIADYEFIYYESNKTKFNVESNNRIQMEIEVPGGYIYYYPKGKFAEQSNWRHGTYAIIKNRNIVANNFEDLDAAKNFAVSKEKADLLLNKENKTENTHKKRKTKFVPEQLKGVTRIGPKYAERKVTGQDYLDVFNVRGGEFGNWMTDKDRQASLDFGYDAFCDLADVLNIEITDISFNGKLAIAFGARGSGNARAHYEPDLKVINLTKLKGAGSLAHEWGHALDDYIGSALGLNTIKLFSEIPLNNEARRKLLPEFSDLLYSLKYKEISTADNKDGKIVQTDFLKGSIKFDGCHSKQEHGYWQSLPEMFARGFDCYVSDKLKEMNRRSDYLTAHSDSYKTVDEAGNIVYAYPRGEERKQINKCFDALFDALKNRKILHEKTKSNMLLKNMESSELKKEVDSISVPKQKLNIDDYNQLSFEDIFAPELFNEKKKAI